MSASVVYPVSRSLYLLDMMRTGSSTITEKPRVAWFYGVWQVDVTRSTYEREGQHNLFHVASWTKQPAPGLDSQVASKS